MIINLTQHSGTPDQGVVEPVDKAIVSTLLTFDEPPMPREMEERAEALASIAKEAGASKAMIGGAPFFMSTLERVLMEHGVGPLYAFSKRVSIDIPIPESEGGGVRKQAVFRHLCFVSSF